MKNDLKRKMYMGFKGFMLPLPLALSSRGMKRGVRGAKVKANSLSDEERRVHHFVVMTMADAKKPIKTESIAKELCMPTDRVVEIIDKLEAMKTFLYRSDGTGINWAYPISLEDTGFKMIASTGEHFFAAWAVDAFATPFVYGRLKNKELSFSIHTECADSGRLIEIKVDSELKITGVSKGSDPMFCMPLLDSERTKELSIVDIF